MTDNFQAALKDYILLSAKGLMLARAIESNPVIVLILSQTTKKDRLANGWELVEQLVGELAYDEKKWIGLKSEWELN